MKISRRDALKAGLAGAGYLSTASLVPNWIVRSAGAIEDASGDDRILVIVQLEGGNDGLNTVVPYTDPRYVDLTSGQPTPGALRVKLQLPVASLHQIDSLNALNAELADLAAWFGSGNMAIIQNVGYPNPDLSHFVSTDYWEQARITGGPLAATTGWIGRFYDQTCGALPGIDPLTLIGAGQSLVPGTLIGDTATPPAIENVAAYALNGGAGLPLALQQSRIATIHAMNDIPTADPNVDYIQRTENVVEASIATVQSITYVPPNSYPDTELARDLELASQIIHTSGIRPKVIHVRQAGYDTHANQTSDASPLVGDQATLLAELNGALHAFLTDLAMTGELDRVLVMTFSEFGRRVAENSSFGTDHGAASVLFVFGGAAVIGGVYGGQPNLQTLQKGNLIQTIDFRNVYSDILRDWFGADPSAILGQSFGPIGFLSSPSASHRRWTKYR